MNSQKIISVIFLMLFFAVSTCNVAYSTECQKKFSPDVCKKMKKENKKFETLMRKQTIQWQQIMQMGESLRQQEQMRQMQNQMQQFGRRPY